MRIQRQKKMEMVKQRYIYIFFIGVFFIFACCNLRNGESLTQKELYNEKLCIDTRNDSLQLAVTNKINEMNFIKQDTLELTINDLLDFSFEEIIIVDRMTIDYSKKCDGFDDMNILQGKEYCQYMIIDRGENHPKSFIRGFCDYNLLGFSKSYDEFGFALLDFSIETINANDTLLVSVIRKPDGSISDYILEPKNHQIANHIKCAKYEP